MGTCNLDELLETIRAHALFYYRNGLQLEETTLVSDCVPAFMQPRLRSELFDRVDEVGNFRQDVLEFYGAGNALTGSARLINF